MLDKYTDLVYSHSMRKAYLVIIMAVIVLGGLYAYANYRDDQKKAQATIQAEENADKPITPDGLYLAINDVRKANSLTQFKRNPLLDQSAQLKCDDMSNGKYYGHDNPTTGKKGYTYISDVVKAQVWASENLNKGIFKDSKSVIDSWMSSEAHKASILDPRYTEIGFATCTVQGQKTVVQHKIESVDKQ